MLSSAAFSSSPLLRGAPLRTRHLLLAPPARAHGGAASRARGGLPRFHAPSLPSSKFRGNISPVTEMDVTLQGEVIRIQGDEFWHMTRVLRLGVNDKVELFNGVGSLAEGFIHKVDKGGSGVELLEDARIIAPQGIQWHVFAAFGQRIHEMSLKSPIQIRHLLPVVSQSKLAFLASAEAPPLFSVLPESSIEQSGLLIIGPEGGNANPELH
ncbi:methyltransferase [Zea mays]|uniref:Methyltransferase n=1 Tax=Zea mays TaxID=4577 RepID=A0A1D6GI90_MAIZE|nr:methyltransferase [Zea mays]